MATDQSAHENLARHDDVKMGTDRNFGFVFAAFCTIVASVQLWKGTGNHWPWLTAAAIFATLATFAPSILRPLNVLWFKLGILLHHIVTPIVLGLMFFVVFTPLGLCMRLTGKRPLSLKFDSKAKSYWVARTPPGPPPESFPNQF